MSNTARESCREDVAGRANVEDTPELPGMHALGLYREEAFGDNGGQQPAQGSDPSRTAIEDGAWRRGV
jgi:hypothetical protein